MAFKHLRGYVNRHDTCINWKRTETLYLDDAGHKGNHANQNQEETTNGAQKLYVLPKLAYDYAASRRHMSERTAEIDTTSHHALT